ncbi:MAG: protease modulator HflK, partial [Hydrogenophilaceae bacterium]|nr:protease modulator HflK [Hydrogenophilaceae bacterium]
MAWNDPQWGKDDKPRGGRGDGGPPDLDELWRNFNQRLNNLFKRKGGSTGGGGGGFGKGMPSFQLPGIGLIVGVIVAVWLASGFYIVDAGQRGVVLRFGKYVETTMPGPRWHLPYPVETVEEVNVDQVRTVEVGYRNNVKSKVQGESLMLTDDENIIDLQFSVQYTLKDPED